MLEYHCVPQSRRLRDHQLALFGRVQPRQVPTLAPVQHGSRQHGTPNAQSSSSLLTRRRRTQAYGRLSVCAVVETRLKCVQVAEIERILFTDAANVLCLQHRVVIGGAKPRDVGNCRHRCRKDVVGCIIAVRCNVAFKREELSR